MTLPEHKPSEKLSRRELLAYTAAFGSTFMAAQGLAAADSTARQPSPAEPPKQVESPEPDQAG